MMIVILGATPSDNSSVHACDFAVIDLTAPAASRILARMDAVTALNRADRSTHEVHFWDANVTFFQRTVDDELDGVIPRDASQFTVVSELVNVPSGSTLWTESERMVIAVNTREPEVYWRARAKHAPVDMQTCSLPRLEIARAAHGDTVLTRGHTPS